MGSKDFHEYENTFHHVTFFGIYILDCRKNLGLKKGEL